MSIMIMSRFAGKCRRCGESTQEGERLLWERGEGAWHPACDGLPALAPEPAPGLDLGDVSGIFSVLDAASAAGVEWPKLRFPCRSHRVRLHIAGERSRYCGEIMLTEDGRWDDSGERPEWYGRLDRSGRFTTSRRHAEICKAIGATLRDVANDPARVLGEIGRTSGECCFCGRELTDGRSLDAGYGATCAAHFGLPWGEAVAS